VVLLEALPVATVPTRSRLAEIVVDSHDSRRHAVNGVTAETLFGLVGRDGRSAEQVEVAAAVTERRQASGIWTSACR